jgi:cytoskeletal protein CcmA (bactofilin family)/uncharacterized membrane protein
MPQAVAKYPKNDILILMKKSFLLFALVGMFLLPDRADAGPIIRSGEVVSVDASQVLKGDFYGFSPTVSLSGQAEDDAYIVGGTITINAPVGKDLTIVGGTTQVHGDVGDDLRVVGGDVVVANAVKGDVVVLGGTLSILSTAVIEGDVIFMGGELTVEGVVNGSIHGTAEKARINATVEGDVSLTAETRVALGDKAIISGNVTYTSREDIVRAQNAQISGTVRKVETPLEGTQNFLKMYVLAVCVLAFAALSVYFIARRRLQVLVERSSRNFGISGLVGLGMFLMIPFVGGVLFVSVIGGILGVLLVALYLLLLILAFVLTGAMLGHSIQKFITKKGEISLSTVFFGTVLFSFMMFVPYVGGLFALACFVVTLGGLGLTLYHMLRS